MSSAIFPGVRIGLWWRDFLCPKEHGSWSLAFEPLALGLLVAPSSGGGCLALALAAGFFARRPLRMAVQHRVDASRRLTAAWTVAGCAGAALFAGAAAVRLGGTAWLIWLLPVAAAGAAFAWFDAHGAGREELAEVSGAAAFALTPATLAILAGWPPLSATALAVVMVGRSVPSVLCVRAFLRRAKTGRSGNGLALVTSSAALLATVFVVARGGAPLFAGVALAAFFLRALALLVVIRPAWRARTVGMLEAVLGVVFVLGLAAAWTM
ncbi:MAG TPA: YwiC-like family protein [Opitutaceae bacterium]|nr:YwiC-like family protein [Opitutaceae bacterium]